MRGVSSLGAMPSERLTKLLIFCLNLDCQLILAQDFFFNLILSFIINVVRADLASGF